MKKLVLGFLAVVMLFAIVPSVNAMTEEQLKEKMEKTYNINGTDFKISNDMKVMLERYLDEYNVTSNDADYISNKIDEAINILKKYGTADVNKLPAAAKSELVSLVEDISAHTSVKATVKNGKLVINRPDGKGVFAEFDKLVKQTGNETNTIAIIAGVSFVIVLAGAFVVTKKFATNK